MTANRSHFTHTSLPGRVVFGSGTLADVPGELDRLGLRAAMVVTTPGRTELATAVAAQLGERCAGVHARAVMHVPAEIVTDAVARARELDADCCLTIGGGSAVGLGKAVALHTGLPVVAVPTTYAGSEMTPVWGITDGHGKRTGRDPRVQPVTVVYDVELTMDLPVAISVTSAVNALAHAAEATYAPDGSPVIDLMAREAAAALLDGLERLVHGEHEAARVRLLHGAWLAGCCLGATTMSLHHKLCHIVAGAFDLDHAWTHTVLLPHVLELNAPVGSDAHSLLPDRLAVAQPGGALYDLLGGLGYRRSLADLGMPAAGIDLAVEQATAAPYANPRPIDAATVRRLLRAALAGDRPQTAN